MKKALYIFGVLIATASFTANGQELEPDQNPNYKNSAEKYAEKSDELTANQGQTIQDTYEAYDWREAKEEAKQQRIDRRYELRKLRIQSRNNCFYGNSRFNRRGYYNNGWNNNGYYNNGWNNNGFNNGGYYNNNNGWNNGFLGGPLPVAFY